MPYEDAPDHIAVDPAPLQRLGDRFREAGYTVPAVRDLLGPVAGGALARDEIVPALRVTTGGSPLETLIRLYWLQVPVPERQAGDLGDDLVACGLAERGGAELRGTVHIEPLEPIAWRSLAGPDGPTGPDGFAVDDGPVVTRYAVSDPKVRPGGERGLGPDHVVGVGGASAALARLVVHRHVDNVLDLGTGSGVQALHLADRAGALVATDVNPRALRMASVGFGLSRVGGVELLQGSLFEPVADRRFDLIVSNPPFVISPDRRFSYRESGLPGDELCRRLVVRAPAHLAEGGHCHLLANWLHVGDADWRDRLGEWLAEAGCDAWVVQREVRDPAEYAEMWLRDSCDHGTEEYRRRYDDWLEYFERQRVRGVGFGWITLRRGGAATPTVRIEELRQEVDQPVGAYVDNVLDGLVAGREFSTEFSTGVALRAVAGLMQEQVGRPGAADPERIVLRQTGGLRRAAGVATVEAALAGVCDGTVPLEPLLSAIAELMDLSPAEVRAHAEAVLPELIADGFFELASPAG